MPCARSVPHGCKSHNNHLLHLLLLLLADKLPHLLRRRPGIHHFVGFAGRSAQHLRMVYSPAMNQYYAWRCYRENSLLSANKSSITTRLPEVGYFAETPRAIKGWRRSSSSSCRRRGALSRNRCLGAFLDLATSSSDSSADLMTGECIVRICVTLSGQETYIMSGSMSMSIASAVSCSQLFSCFDFLTACCAFSISRAILTRSLSFGKNPGST